MASYNTEKLNSISILEIANKLGLAFNNQNKTICINPEHDDKHPSLSYDPKRNILYCFSCQTRYDCIELVKTLKSLSFQGACQWLQGDINHFAGVRISYKQQPVKNKKITYKQMDKNKCDEAKRYHNYLVDNWIEFEDRITWNLQTVKDTFTGFDPIKNRFCFVESDTDGQWINLKYHKSIDKKPPFSIGDGTTKLYPMMLIQVYDQNKPLYYCEGEKDCLTLISKGFQACTGTTGASSIPADLSLIQRFKKIIICYDKDEAGEKGKIKLAKKINELYPGIQLMEMKL